ncbi:transporter [Ganoderma sinense ZZ0214-1]|uniref:Transporter n=1 Tax=Ganoderma sinense ZZ0214-1 TaxID=1077348 RepID=A0A2G8SSV8_9APHY|nr:transporter [Ganoderma sinense ZZ0214-1]
MLVPPHLLLDLDDLPGGIDLPRISTATAAGIGVAIAGNVLISLALNCQKLAHRRLQREREALANAPQPLKPTSSNGRIVDRPHYDDTAPSHAPTRTVAVLETEPLLPQPDRVETDPARPGRGWFFFRRKSFHTRARDADRTHLASTHALMPVETTQVPSQDATRHENGEPKLKPQNAAESDYLRSKLWWFGFLLMNIGETGNFISYAFAPASVVAPLGTFALIANCIFAPLMLKERFRKRDFLGIIIAILGAVTVVLSANPSDTRLDPKGLIAAISTRPFEIYALTYLVGIVLLSGLSEGPAGKRFVYVDVGLCALFGGFTVLSTKAFSTLLTLEWFQIFKEWITYPVVAVLLGTGIGQIRYLNRALMRFDSKIVVPTQFVTFNLSAIVGSAILYGDFKKATFHQLLTFLYGCGATFLGVFIISWSPRGSPQPEYDEEEGDPEEEDDDTDPMSAETVTMTGTSVAESATASPSAFGSVRTLKGSISRRARPALAIPDGMGSSASDSGASHALRNRHSVVSLYGFSPAQRVLLIGSSPRDELFVRPNLDPERERDRERDYRDPERDPNASPESISRRRAVNWLDEGFSLSSQPSSQTCPRRTTRYGATSSDAASREGSRIRVDSPPTASGRARTNTNTSTSVGSGGFSRSRSRGRDRSESPIDPFR